MVVIEPEENEKTLAEKNPPKPKASSSSATKTTTDSSSDDNTGTTATTATKVDGNDSDGFETASEHGVSGDEEEDDNEQTKNNSSTSAQDQQREEEAENDDESKQRGLAEANEKKMRGNYLFGIGEYEEALIQYDIALQVAPSDMPSSVELRSNCHSNRAICFFKLGKYEDTIKECTKALELNPSYMKALVRRGEAHEKLEHFEEAIADMKKILELDPSNDQAKRAIRHLEPLAAEKREKMKEEMIGKLKEMGNSVLGRFGMSIDNFKAVKDPNTGSYSISFQR